MMNPRDMVLDAFLGAVSGERWSRTVGALAAREVPQPLLQAAISAYVKAYGVDLSEAAEPVESFRSFNAFFTRALREGARPVCEGEATVASPADGALLNHGTLADGRLRQIKGRDYGLDELLGSAEEAEALRCGRYATIYLSPRDYHRVHCPLDGHIVGWRYIPGALYPVNRLGLDRVDRLFATNERLVTLLDTPAAGRVAVIMVGATSVGNISVTYDGIHTNTPPRVAREERLATPIPVRKGDELGRFNLGSTVVLLVQGAHMRFVGLAEGQRLRMGEALMSPES